ncbi:MAG: exopolyphosphatase [Bacteroidetes bacterium]|nr:exopolyphosphatase [Bacteroidota bacterium]
MHQQRVAVIDCGTNTFNLLVAEKKGDGWKFLCRRKRVVKLGSQGIRNRLIGPIPAQKALAALMDYKELINGYKVDKTIIHGTAALRDAINGPLFLEEIKRKTGFTIQLIDGDREAFLIYKGVQSAMTFPESCSLIMDIGGGSTEFILCNDEKIHWKKSFRLGAARLAETLAPSDPIRPKEVADLNKLLEKELESLLQACDKFKPERLIGSSGSFDTFANIILRKYNLKLGRKTHYIFKLSEYRTLHRELLSSTYKERLRIPGMLKMRADMILLASLLLTFVLRKATINEIHLSTHALKEGILADLK